MKHILLGLTLIGLAQMQQIKVNGPKLSAEDYGDQAYADVKNLNNLAVQYFNKICRDNGRSDGCYKYVDIDGKQDKNWPSRKIDVIDIAQLQYSVIQQIQKPSLTLSQDYCNSLSIDGSFEFKKSTSTSTDCSWSVTNGLASTSAVEVSVGIPELAQTKFSESITLDFSKTQSQSTTHVDTWEVSTTVPVPAFTYVNATYVVMETDFDTTWTANITFSGCANVWFNDKIDGHWEWWHGVDSVYGGVPGFSCWYQDPPSGEDFCQSCFCNYQASGTYYGIGGAAAHLNTDSASCKKNEEFLTQ